MIVDAFTESLEIGLESSGQVVVSTNWLILSGFAFYRHNFLTREWFAQCSL